MESITLSKHKNLVLFFSILFCSIVIVVVVIIAIITVINSTEH